ncbi:hypothetical protein [Pseudomonas sp. TE3610]
MNTLGTHRRAGDLDLTFAEQGVFRTGQHAEDGKGAQPAVLKRLSDGRLIVGLGGYRDGFWLTRLTSQGAPDQGFATAGSLRYRFLEATAYGYVLSSVQQSADSTLLVLGAYTRSAPLETRGFALKLRENGTPDPGFGSDGLITFGLPDFRHTPSLTSHPATVQACVQSPSGRLLFAINSVHPSYLDPAYLVALRPDGQPDSSFGQQGFRQFFHGDQNRLITGLTEQNIGTQAYILAVGHTSTPPYLGLVARYTAEGELDLGFGKDGFFVLDQRPKFQTRLRAITLNADGTALCTGDLQHEASHNNRLLRLKLTVDGHPDPSYGEQGIATVEGDYKGDAIDARLDGLSVVTGALGAAGMISRANPDGAPDLSFGANGQVLDPDTLSLERAVIEPDSHILTLGISADDAQPVLKRWLGA